MSHNLVLFLGQRPGKSHQSTPFSTLSTGFLRWKQGKCWSLGIQILLAGISLGLGFGMGMSESYANVSGTPDSGSDQASVSPSSGEQFSTSVRLPNQVRALLSPLQGWPLLGTRGLCLLSPGLLEDRDVIWSDRPLFLWHTAEGYPLRAIEVRNYDTDELLWEWQADSLEKKYAFYTGAALEPGQVYRWKISPGMQEFTFEIMDLPDRDQIATELQNLTTELEAAGTLPLEIALAQARYFAEKALWSDALAMLYRFEDPPPELTEAIQAATDPLCTARGGG